MENDIESKVFKGRIKVPYSHVAGEYVKRFLTEIGKNKKIMGIKCPKCAKIYVPPKKICFECFQEMDEWVEVGLEGTVKGFTVVSYSTPVIPLEPPFAYAIIEFDGANTSFVHILKESDPSKIKTGMRVKAIFKDAPQGNILDIQYFQAV